MIRRSVQRLQYHGRISSMLELGGAPAGHTTQERAVIDTSQNNKVRACILDFDVLVRNTSFKENKSSSFQKTSLSDDVTTTASGISPDMERVNNFASLLNIELGSTMKLSKEPDNLTGLEEPSSTTTTTKTPSQDNPYKKKNYFNDFDKSSVNMKAPPANDVRSKYASKMRSKMDQGYTNTTMNKGDDTRVGDAKDLRMARKIIASKSSSTSNKWIAATDTGKLLNYLSSRSMKIALLPRHDDNDSNSTFERMGRLTEQLPNINFDVVLKAEENMSSSTMIDTVLSKWMNKAVTPLNVLVVSDNEDLLHAAREKGMFSCRVRLSPSAPRGIVSVNYNKECIADVQDVIDDINGISFNTVLESGGR